jgi:bifunctional N-acetylglucosamine-1-phosphate-uridyltransferase/glucosamine-1-phosphate-acetyltransferase GlmU-like protein
MKRTIAIVTLAVVGLIAAGSAIAQQRPQSAVALHGQRQAQPQGQRTSSAGASDVPTG